MSPPPHCQMKGEGDRLTSIFRDLGIFFEHFESTVGHFWSIFGKVSCNQKNNGCTSSNQLQISQKAAIGPHFLQTQLFQLKKNL